MLRHAPRNTAACVVGRGETKVAVDYGREEEIMPRFQFQVCKGGVVREAGAVLSESFDEALSAIAEQSDVTEGETLEIGVPGFPPARYDFHMPAVGMSGWRPKMNTLAA